MFGMLAEELLLVEGIFPHRDSGCATWLGQADEWFSVDKGVLCRCEDKPKVAVLAPSAGTLDRRRVRSEEMMGVLDRAVAWFSLMLGEV